jgi:probable lipoprotein NlpC
VGIYAGGGNFIHSASSGPNTGVIYSRLDEAYWRRTFLGAGRALPWDDEAAEAMAALRSGNVAPSEGNAPGSLLDIVPRSIIRAPAWADSGYFVGFASAWAWGGFFNGIPSAFRGFTALATVGHKWPSFRASLELRSEWDNALGVLRLPLALSVGTDAFQIFGGPALILGEPSLSLGNQERNYSGGGRWLWEAGLSASFLTFHIWQGALSLFGELAWQSYQLAAIENPELRHDIAANLRVSTGVRYLWHLR